MTTDTELTHWSTRAINLPDHANNLIHTDEGARAAGFPGALVAGATIYAYMTHPQQRPGVPIGSVAAAANCSCVGRSSTMTLSIV